MSKKCAEKPIVLNHLLVPAELIEPRIFMIGGHRVILDRDLAVLYEVKAIALRQQIKRNKDDFLRISCSSSRSGRPKLCYHRM
jgi:hypothetical protein